jgi:hypothetical protein
MSIIIKLTFEESLGRVGGLLSQETDPVELSFSIQSSATKFILCNVIMDCDNLHRCTHLCCRIIVFTDLPIAHRCKVDLDETRLYTGHAHGSWHSRCDFVLY